MRITLFFFACDECREVFIGTIKEDCCPACGWKSCFRFLGREVVEVAFELPKDYKLFIEDEDREPI